MRKEEFLNELERLLADLPEEERREAVEYYRSYIEDADSEAEALEMLGDPARVAAQIRVSMNGGQGGFDGSADFGSGYSGPQSPEASGSDRPRQNSTAKIVLFVILVILASPLLFGLGGGLFGILTGLVGTLFGLVVGLAGLTLGCIAGGVGVLIAGIWRLATLPMIGIALLGSGIFMLGLGAFFVVLCILFYGRFLPWLWRSLTDAVRGLLQGFRKGGRR